MDVFDLRARLVADYQSYTRSFIKIADPRIKAKVDGALERRSGMPVNVSGAVHTPLVTISQ